MAELADAQDLKSCVLTDVRVQVPPRVLIKQGRALRTKRNYSVARRLQPVFVLMVVGHRISAFALAGLGGLYLDNLDKQSGVFP